MPFKGRDVDAALVISNQTGSRGLDRWWEYQWPIPHCVRWHNSPRATSVSVTAALTSTRLHFWNNVKSTASMSWPYGQCEPRNCGVCSWRYASFANATSGSITPQPVTGALRSSVLSLPAKTGRRLTASGRLQNLGSAATTAVTTIEDLIPTLSQQIPCGQINVFAIIRRDDSSERAAKTGASAFWRNEHRRHTTDQRQRRGVLKATCISPGLILKGTGGTGSAQGHQQCRLVWSLAETDTSSSSSRSPEAEQERKPALGTLPRLHPLRFWLKSGSLGNSTGPSSVDKVNQNVGSGREVRRRGARGPAEASSILLNSSANSGLILP